MTGKCKTKKDVSFGLRTPSCTAHQTIYRTCSSLVVTFFSYKPIFSQLVLYYIPFLNTKLKIYKTLIRPILSYRSETWTLTIEETNTLRISERKIIRKIYGPIKEGDSWRIRTNKETKDILQGEIL
jgi:hypothetical protein